MLQFKQEQVLSWIGGFFDGEGSCSFSQGSPSIDLVNTNPEICYFIMNTFQKLGINAKISERSKPSKSSKKKRWDIFIHQADECFKFCDLMKPYIKGKQSQINLIQEYKAIRKRTKEFHERMRFLNQTNGILILDPSKLQTNWSCEVYNKTNSTIEHVDFSDIYYAAGLFDAEGTLHINNQGFVPQITCVNTNKIICSHYVSAMSQHGINCYIQTRIPTCRNRIRWDIMIYGIKRSFDFCELMLDKVYIKQEQMKILKLYLQECLQHPDSRKQNGYVAKMAIQSLRK